MKATRVGLAAIGICLILWAGCTTVSAPGGGGELLSTQVLYRSSGFVHAESFSSIMLLVEKAASPDGGTYTLAATLMYNDMPHVDSLLIRAGQDAATVRDEHPRTVRRLIGVPRFTTRLTFALDGELVRGLGGAQGIVVQYGDERITLSARERAVLQSFLAAPDRG